MVSSGLVVAGVVSGLRYSLGGLGLGRILEKERGGGSTFYAEVGGGALGPITSKVRSWAAG